MDEFLKEIIVEAGELAMKYFRREKALSFKAKTSSVDIVTEADEAVSAMLVSRISQKFPTHTIYSEELPDLINPGGDHRWIIDPIDGTRNFALGLSSWCVLIAVEKNNEPYLGAIYAPVEKIMYSAEAEKGAFCGDKPIKVNETSAVASALTFFGISFFGKNVQFFKEILAKLVDLDCWLMNYGTMLPSAYLATGQADLYLNNIGYDHDFCAPALICREAGAIVVNGEGKPWRRGDRDLIIANPKIYAELEQILAPLRPTT